MANRVELHQDSGLPMIDDGSGAMRVLARLPPYPRSPFASIGRRVALKAPNQWQEVNIASWQTPHLMDQGQHGSCVGHGTGTAFEAAWVQTGQKMPPAPFSGCYIYGWVNGGEDNGAVISDAAAAVKMHGVCTEAEVPEGLIYLAQFPQSANQVAQHYKPLLVMRCQTYDEICGALAEGFPVVIGITVGRNFSNIDGFGLAPLPDVPLGGHCLAALELKNHPQRGWVIGVQNSWGRWGVGGAGRCYLRREHFDSPTDAFAVVAVASDAGDIPVAMLQKGQLMAKKKNETAGGPKADEAAASAQDHGATAHSASVGGEGEHEHVKMQAQKCGFDMTLVTSWAQRYGPTVIEDAIALQQNGFSVEWVTQTLENLGLAGPAALEFIRGLHQKAQARMKSADPIQEGVEVGPQGIFDKKMVLTLLVKQIEGMLPSLGLAGPSLVIAQAVLDGIVAALSAQSA